MREACVLLVEGKSLGNNSLSPALEKEGYVVHVAHTGTAALAWAANNSPHILVFDASSMRSSGTRSCRRLHRALPDTPLIHCRTSEMPEDRAAEADIYLQQPFTPRKLLNRIRALLPADDTEEQIVRLGDITIYLGKRSVEVAGRGERRLTPKLARLLEEFMRHPNEILDRPQLMKNVWKTSYIGDTRTLDVHIRWIRELIEAEPGRPQLLKTVRGKGYILNIPPPE